MKNYQDEQWKAGMTLRLDYTCMMESAIGKTGISRSDLDTLAPRLDAAWKAVEEGREKMEWRDLPWSQRDTISKIRSVAEKVREMADNFIVLGIGGSALGPMAVHQALNHLHYNEMEKSRRGGPRLYVEDNIDPERMASLLDVIDARRSVFNVVSKSGTTAETMSQFLIITRILKERLGNGWKSHIIVTTDAEKGCLRSLVEAEGFASFVIPRGVGGRFSELCAVGLLPAAVTGINIDELLAGAGYMDAVCKKSAKGNPALLDAALQYLCMQKSINISVLIPYADSLKYMSDWYAQLWAESLGKKFGLDGSIVHAGQTPVKALGVTDQHSQIQLYTEGPYDKVVTFVQCKNFRSSAPIPEEYAEVPELCYLNGFSLEELIDAEYRATRFALSKAGRPNKTLILPAVNAFTIGQLLYFFEVETAYTAQLLGINAFDQPGVEEGKKATYALFGREGYAEKKKELESSPFLKPVDIV